MNERRVIALGFFDGVHIGHGALLKKTCERATELGAIPAAMSFDTHPDTLVFGTPTELLNTMDERKQLMQSLYGIEDVIFCHFDKAMMNMDWEAFVEDYLVRELHACHLVCGHDYHFGARGFGNAERLTEKCRVSTFSILWSSERLTGAFGASFPPAVKIKTAAPPREARQPARAR